MRTQQAINEAQTLLERATDLLIEDPRDHIAQPLLVCAASMCLIATNNFVNLADYPHVMEAIKNPPYDLLDTLEQALQDKESP